MSDEPIAQPDDTPADDARRKGDRRKGQQPFDGPDRRKDDRRSGDDRRTTERS
ncbi:hypothetical protein J3454_08195 [Erythrobacter sp. NFXS35]|uniref:hypothetical protein n=1 Tax=unclassified Erythrobacter TaxID=2633097 RepID=UPI0025E86104|nr:hypothetical protein [Erythrobacter sp.]